MLWVEGEGVEDWNNAVVVLIADPFHRPYQSGSESLSGGG